MLNDFDARSVQPQQGMTGHPPGIFEFQITNTYLKDNQKKDGAMLVVEMTSPVGRIENRYNIANPNAKAVEIAQKELSALCHAVGIFQVKYPKNPDGTPIYEQAGITLRGGRGKMEIVPQKDGTGKETGYMEVNKVFDLQGNEPGKGPSQPAGNWSGGNAQPQQQPNGQWNNNQPPQQNTQPAQNQPQGNTGWNAQQQPNNPPQGGNGNGWQGQPNQQQPNQQPQQQGNQPNPPWANR